MSTKLKLALSVLGYLCVCGLTLARSRPVVTARQALAVAPVATACAPCPRCASATPAAVFEARPSRAVEDGPPSLQRAFEAAVGRGDFVFARDASKLTPENNARLDAIAQWLGAHPRAALAIEGHMGDYPVASVNRDVSAHRAAAVARGLRVRGIAWRQLRVYGMGAEGNRAARTDDDRAFNRRVEMRVVEVP